MYSTWTQIGLEIERLSVESDEGFHHRTIANAQLFVTFADGRYRVADDVGKGYRATIRLTWSFQPHPIEVEVLENHYEFYRFLDGKTEIREVPCTPDNESIPHVLKSVLDPILSTRV